MANVHLPMTIGFTDYRVCSKQVEAQRQHLLGPFSANRAHTSLFQTNSLTEVFVQKSDGGRTYHL